MGIPAAYLRRRESLLGIPLIEVAQGYALLLQVLEV